MTRAALERVLRLGSWVGAGRGRTALAWAAATFLALAALAGTPGISRDEAAVLEAGDPALRDGPAAARVAVRPSAPLSQLAGATGAAFGPLGLSHLRAARLATAVLGALLSASLALLAWDLAGRSAALLAPALFWAVPRHLHAGLVATPDLAVAALVTATVLAYRRATMDADRRRTLRAAARAGLLFGAAAAARVDAWILLPVLAVHAAAARALGAGDPARGEGRRLRIPAALVAMAVLGPLVLFACWSALGWSPLARGALSPAAGVAGAWRDLAARLPGRGWAVPAMVTALTVPATVLLAYLAGVVHALLRLLGAGRSAETASDELLLLLCAAAPFAAAGAGLAPAAGGVRPWLHAMPFLAVLGARALVAAARVAWPARAAPLVASLALLVLWPGFRAALHFHPAGASAWNELAGGAPGAATLGLPRQDGGEAAAAVLDALNARARDGARVFWPATAPAALRAFVRDGRLRADLGFAESPEQADVAVVALDGGSRDDEYRAWSAFGTARPAAGAYLDEVPLALVYARPGAWR